MYISAPLDQLEQYGGMEESALLFKESGFDAVDVSLAGHLTYRGKNHTRFLDFDDYRERAAAFRAYLDSIGLVCNQTHGPYPANQPFYDDVNARVYALTKRAIEVSGILGAKVIVVHGPTCGATVDDAEAFYKGLLPAARESGVMIGVENIVDWNTRVDCAVSTVYSDPAQLKKLMDRLDERYFGVCVDTGHAALEGSPNWCAPADIVHVLGRRVVAMHLHDNDLRHDLHKLPFTEKIDYTRFIDELIATGYEGDVTTECSHFVPAFPVELYPAAMKMLAAVADWFRRKITDGVAKNRP